jgi:hypothetical protein
MAMAMSQVSVVQVMNLIVMAVRQTLMDLIVYYSTSQSSTVH